MNEVVTLRMANPKAANIHGSITAIVSSLDNNTFYFLTCSHVALAGSGEDKKGLLPVPENITILDNGLEIGQGQLVFARLNKLMDIALVKVQNPLSGRINAIPGLPALKKPVARESLRPNQKFGFYSSLRKQIVWGKIIQPKYAAAVNLNYEYSVRIFNDVILLATANGQSATSQKGDSGSLLFTEDMAPFGILFGGASSRDYAIPLLDVLNHTHTKIP